MDNRNREHDHLDELIDASCQDAEFAELWRASEARMALAKLRKESNLTQQQVADRMGVARPRVAEIERNPMRVSMGRMMKYAAAIGVSLAAVETELNLHKGV